MPSVNTIGRNTHTVVRVDAVIAPATCFAPETAACTFEYPRFLKRYVFSITTMELSTSIPTPKARPESDITLSVTLLKYISVTANSKLIGIEQAIIAVGFMSLRNTSKTIIAKIPP